jgi:hypothetical protein
MEECMPGQQHTPDRATEQEDRAAVERRVRQTLDEIRSAIDHLELTCRQGRITASELAEERALLRAQEQVFRGGTD